jgi:hypothetical protein
MVILLGSKDHPETTTTQKSLWLDLCATVCDHIYVALVRKIASNCVWSGPWWSLLSASQSLISETHVTYRHQECFLMWGGPVAVGPIASLLSVCNSLRDDELSPKWAEWIFFPMACNFFLQRSVWTAASVIKILDPFLISCHQYCPVEIRGKQPLVFLGLQVTTQTNGLL